MAYAKVNIKKYPQKNPSIDLETTTRFAVKAVEAVVDGQTKIIEELGSVEPDCPECDFKYDATTGLAKFVKRTDKDGNVITRRSRPIAPYIPGKDLIELVRLAQILQRPVLIKGEPGSGKTQLAKAVAYEWYGEEYKQHFFEWQVKSTSKAVDGLYTFDHIERLRDANFKNEAKVISDYRNFGPMGMAFLTSTADAPSILLIDEIDKADIDFPNDLLLELDERRFTIPETNELIEAKYPPVIFITSNDERELPEAFLRRCLFLYIKFPDKAQLVNIIKAHIPGLVEGQAAFIDEAINRFNKLREEIELDPADNKRVSTSELLDWLGGYNYEFTNGIKEKKIDLELTNLPQYYQALLKTYRAVNRREQAIESSKVSVNQ